MATQSKTNKGVLAAEIGAGILAAAAAAGTGYYFYTSDSAKKNRKIAAKWAGELKRDVIKRAKAMQAASPKAFATKSTKRPLPTLPHVTFVLRTYSRRPANLSSTGKRCARVRAH